MKVRQSSKKKSQKNERPQKKTNKWVKKNFRTPISSKPAVDEAVVMPFANVNKKPHLKRLKNKVKAVKDNETGQRNSHAHTNGKSELKTNNTDDDYQEWSSYAQTVLQNGVGSSNGKGSESASRLDENSFHLCAERDDVNKRTVLVMQRGQTLCFRGKCQLSCLYGRVEVMGFTIEEGQQSYPLFSPATHCPLTIAALGQSSESDATGASDENRMDALAVLRKYLNSSQRKRLLNWVNSNSCLILLEPLETSLTRFLYSLPGFEELFEPTQKEIMSAMLDTPLNFLGVTPLHNTTGDLKISKSYRDTLDALVHACKSDVDGCPVILVCGSKNVGKSTFIRHLINTLLNHTTSVDYMEGDLGQTEFTPPGCLSISSVSEPLLGPPFTHQRTTEHMIYFGQTTCDSDATRYLDSLKTLWRLRSTNREAPVIINTLGWVKGLGRQLLVDVIRLFPVSQVVQICHNGPAQCPHLTPEHMRSAQGFLTQPPAQTALDGFMENHGTPKSPAHYLISSEFEGAGRVGRQKYQRSAGHRELAVLAYLSQLQSPDPGPARPLHSLTPYQVPQSAVAVGVLHRDVQPSHMMYALNANLVALCCLGEKVTSKGGPVLLSKVPTCSCLGFGIVRGVDIQRGLYFLLTPVEPSVLKQVNCFLLGTVLLPSSIFTTQLGIEEEPPYVSTNYNFVFSGGLRSFRKTTKPT
ncbi:polynucleotide 5'-hydroxyl-kinase NOL9 [Aplochiton taeniatus]